MTRARGRREQGATLLVTLIMLIMLTLFAISAMNSSILNLRMSGNMQMRSEALDASQRAIEQAISTTRFVEFPDDVIPAPCNSVYNQTCTDINNDGTFEYVTKLEPKPACIVARVTKVKELDIAGPTSEDVACVQQQAQGTFGVEGASTAGDSLCGQTVWDITASTTAYGSTAATSDVSFTATQGVGVRVRAIDIAAACP